MSDFGSSIYSGYKNYALSDFSRVSNSVGGATSLDRKMNEIASTELKKLDDPFSKSPELGDRTAKEIKSSMLADIPDEESALKSNSDPLWDEIDSLLVNDNSIEDDLLLNTDSPLNNNSLGMKGDIPSVFSLIDMFFEENSEEDDIKINKNELEASKECERLIFDDMLSSIYLDIKKDIEAAINDRITFDIKGNKNLSHKDLEEVEQICFSNETKLIKRYIEDKGFQVNGKIYLYSQQGPVEVKNIDPEFTKNISIGLSKLSDEERNIFINDLNNKKIPYLEYFKIESKITEKFNNYIYLLLTNKNINVLINDKDHQSKNFLDKNYSKYLEYKKIKLDKELPKNFSNDDLLFLNKLEKNREKHKSAYQKNKEINKDAESRWKISQERRDEDNKKILSSYNLRNISIKLSDRVKETRDYEINKDQDLFTLKGRKIIKRML